MVRIEILKKFPVKQKPMDQLIKQLLQGEIFWYENTNPPPPPPAPPVRRSAFAPYPNTPRIDDPAAAGCNINGVNNNSGNVNKRMIEILRKNWSTDQTKDNEKNRGFRHMMNERTRREKQKRSYFALYSVLPIGTKNDKNSIVQTATKRVQELECLKKDLESRNYELQTNLDQNINEGLSKIRVRIENPTSGIDSMLTVLKCLKKLDSKPRMIQSKLTNQQFIAVLDIETQMRVAELEKVVNSTVQEAERKLHKL